MHGWANVCIRAPVHAWMGECVYMVHWHGVYGYGYTGTGVWVRVHWPGTLARVPLVHGPLARVPLVHGPLARRPWTTGP